MGDPWTRSHKQDKDRPELGVLPACELDGEGEEYKLEVSPILEVLRGEEGGPEQLICILFTIVCAMVFFPVPANPFNQ